MDISRRRFFAGRQMQGTVSFRPPWSLSELQFTARCSRCDDCVSACPSGLLVRGDGGFPVADFKRAACTFCADCVRVCATGALARSEDQMPWNFGIEIAANCLPLQGVECRVCGEACDSAAIRFRPRLGGNARPEVDSASCTGCGACIAPCPVQAIQRIALPAGASASQPVPECS